MTTGNDAATFCTSCGSSIEPGFRFCGSCGTPVSSAPVEERDEPAFDGRATIVDDMSAVIAQARSKKAAEPEPQAGPVPAPAPAQQTPPPQPEPTPVPAAFPPPAAHGYPPPAFVAPVAYAAPVVVQQGTSTNGFAIASLVLGIVWLYWLGSLLALIFGAVALAQIKNAHGRQTGEGMAIAGLVLGIVGLVILLVLIIVGATLA